MRVDNKTLIEGASGPLTFRIGDIKHHLTYSMHYVRSGRSLASAAKEISFALAMLGNAMSARFRAPTTMPQKELERVQAEIRLTPEDRLDHQQEQRRNFRSFVDQKMGDGRRKAEWRR